MHKLFTIVVDYEGGTYLSQSNASSLEDFLSRLGDLMAWDAMKVPLSERKIVYETLDPLPVDGLKNVWCVSADFSDKPCLAHVILTAE